MLSMCFLPKVPSSCFLEIFHSFHKVSCLITHVLQVAAQFHGAEVGAAHGTVLTVRMAAFIEVFQSAVGIQTQMELVAPTEFVTCLA